MKVVGLVAVNVFKESVRDKVLYSIIAFRDAADCVVVLIGKLTAGQDIKIIKDLGLASISMFGLLIAIFIGIGSCGRKSRSAASTRCCRSRCGGRISCLASTAASC
jgi:hypothetical protein